MYKRGKLGKTKRQIRRASRGWSFSSSPSSSITSLFSSIKNLFPFQAKSRRRTSSRTSVWRSVSSGNGKGRRRSSGRSTRRRR